MALATSEAMAFDFTWQPKQAQLVDLYENSKATKIGFGGSRGGAKSHTSDDLMIYRRLKYPKTGGLFVMRILDDLNDIHIEPLIARYPILDNWYHKQKKRITFPNGSYIRFISVENIKELKKRAGRGFADIIVDQSELFSQDELEFLATINRHVSVDANKEFDPNEKQIVPKMLFTFNPGGIGHAYHKRIFIERSFEENEVAEDYAFIQAFGWDNAFWCLDALRKDGLSLHDYHVNWSDKDRFNLFTTKSNYGKVLNALPDSKRKAQLFGDFDVFEGQFFSNFRRRHHVIPYNLRSNMNTVGGFDYGNISALTVLQRDVEGTVIAADELYLDNIETPSERAELLGTFLLERKLFKLKIMCDTDMYIDQVSNVESKKKPIQIFDAVLSSMMGENKPILMKVNKTSLDNKKQYRGSINDAVLDYLRIVQKTDEDGEVYDYSRLYICDKAKWLIRSFSELIHPEESPNGLDYDNKHPMRHQFDGFKYAFQVLYTPPKIEKLTAKQKWEKQRQFVEALSEQERTIPYDARNDW